jgi:hypothetical protein
VQQLDDDEAQIRAMSLDQVLQLLKWLVFQCCKPLDCPTCPDPSAIHTVRLMLCDRLAEFFECVHLRIKRVGAILTGSCDDPCIASASSNRLCESSGLAANMATCSTLLFSDDFRTKYSDEEQIHMIRVLWRLQTRNYHKLLLRVEGASHTAANPARQSKVKTLMARLSRAAMESEEALRVVIRCWSLGVAGASPAEVVTTGTQNPSPESGT